MDFRAATRETTITKVELYRTERSSHSPMFGFFKSIADAKALPDMDAYWIVDLTERCGVWPETTNHDVFATKEEAQKFLDLNKVGTVRPSMPDFLAPKILRMLQSDDFYASSGLSSGLVLAAPNGDGYLPWFIKEEAGLNDYGASGVSEEVAKKLGPERIQKLKDEIGENFCAAADMEFSLEMLPASSALYIACACEFHTFITHDDYSAGYYLRDLEMIVHGVEDASKRAFEFAEKQSKRAAKGGEVQAALAEERKREFVRVSTETVSQWIWRSENEQINYLRRATLANDKKNGSGLFVRASKPLSKDWYKEALSELRQSGKLERSVKRP